MQPRKRNHVHVTYLTAVGTAPCSGERSTVIDDGVAPGVIPRLIQPSLNWLGSDSGLGQASEWDLNKDF